MKRAFKNIIEGISRYRFEIRHLTVLFFVLIAFQIIISIVHKVSLQKILFRTQEWYQQDSAERMANLTTTSLELLLEAKSPNQLLEQREINKIIGDLNIILSQQYLHQNVQEICLLVVIDSTIAAIDDGQTLYSYVYKNSRNIPKTQKDYSIPKQMFAGFRNEFTANERIHTIITDKQTFHIFVPFVPRGEFAGVMYMKNTPDFSTITDEMISTYDETAITYSALILFGLLAMFFISTYTLRERNKAQHLLFDEQKKHLMEQVSVQNELLFTKRIYHTHHKAEKVMGFIKEDLHVLRSENIDAVKTRINKYANFIARVIYDMKWYEPPIQTIRSGIFKTNLNDVLEFLVQFVFKRISSSNDMVNFTLDLDPNLPPVGINEFVVWEVFEPIIQNSIDHSENNLVTVTIASKYDPDAQCIIVSIKDNGKGIEPWLLEINSDGVKNIFHEHSSTKKSDLHKHSGYGCYIAYEIAKLRCGWSLDVENIIGGGCIFTFIIPYNNNVS